MTVLYGKPIADAILARVREDVAAFGRAPHLVILSATARDDSRTYVAQKAKAAATVGIACTVDDVPEGERTTDALVARVARWSTDATVDGIVVQFPLPDGVDAHAVLETIVPEKDVDGLTSTNFAAAYFGMPGFRAATAAACIAILDHYGISIAGQRAVVVGRSRLVGLPLAGMLMRRNATVTIAHTKTSDLHAVCQQAELLVVSTGVPDTVTARFVSPGATVVDVGWTRKNGRIVGDVGADVATVAGALTPVPGGVGPVTVAMLLAHSVAAAQMLRV